MVERALTLGRISEACLPWRLMAICTLRSARSSRARGTSSSIDLAAAADPLALRYAPARFFSSRLSTSLTISSTVSD